MFKCPNYEMKPKDLRPSYGEVNKEPSRFYCADVVDTTKSAVRNYGGYCRSDIALINEESNAEVAANLLNRLVERPSDGSVDMTPEQLRLSHRSKYCQTPSEQCLWIENQMEIADNKALANLEEEQRENAEKERSRQRKAFEDSLTSEEKEMIRKMRRDKELKSYVED